MSGGRSALLASVAIHLGILALLLGVGFTVRQQAIHVLNIPGPDVPRDSAGFGGLQSGRGVWRGGCERTGDSTSMELVRSVQGRVSGVAARDSGSVILPAMDASLVHAIDADSLCQRAGSAIDEIVRTGAGYLPRRIFLVRAGSVYLAVDTALRRTVPGQAFVLDSTVSRVLSRGRR